MSLVTTIKGHRVSILVFISLTVILLVPYPSTITKEQRFLVVDKSGLPIRNAIARSMWSDYTYGIDGIEWPAADENGVIVLPEHKFWAH